MKWKGRDEQVFAIISICELLLNMYTRICFKFQENWLQNTEQKNLRIYLKMLRKIGIKTISLSHFAIYPNIVKTMETNI